MKPVSVIMFGGNQSGKTLTNRDQKGWRMYLATMEWSTPLYLYLRSVATPWLPTYPISPQARIPGRRREGGSE